MLGASENTDLRRLRLLCAGLALLLPLGSNAAEISSGVVHFSLCRTNIQSIQLFRAGEQWGMMVTIEPAAAKELVGAAREHPEHTLEVRMGDTLLHRGPIGVAARAPTFTSLRPDFESAKRDVELLRGNLYEGPCGVVAVDEG
jgi:hypothetical protein